MTKWRWLSFVLIWWWILCSSSWPAEDIRFHNTITFLEMFGQIFLRLLNAKHELDPPQQTSKTKARKNMMPDKLGVANLISKACVTKSITWFEMNVIHILDRILHYSILKELLLINLILGFLVIWRQNMVEVNFAWNCVIHISRASTVSWFCLFVIKLM